MPSLSPLAFVKMICAVAVPSPIGGAVSPCATCATAAGDERNSDNFECRPGPTATSLVEFVVLISSAPMPQYQALRMARMCAYPYPTKSKATIPSAARNLANCFRNICFALHHESQISSTAETQSLVG